MTAKLSNRHGCNIPNVRPENQQCDATDGTVDQSRRERPQTKIVAEVAIVKTSTRRKAK
jgi:hypothetical protein